MPLPDVPICDARSWEFLGTADEASTMSEELKSSGAGDRRMGAAMVDDVSGRNALDAAMRTRDFR